MRQPVARVEFPQWDGAPLTRFDGLIDTGSDYSVVDRRLVRNLMAPGEFRHHPIEIRPAMTGSQAVLAWPLPPTDLVIVGDDPAERLQLPGVELLVTDAELNEPLYLGLRGFLERTGLVMAFRDNDDGCYWLHRQ